MSNSAIDTWIIKLLNAKTLEQLFASLVDFSLLPWTLVERAIISNAYTPRAMKLTSMLDGYDKWKWIEILAELCWSKPKVSTDIFAAFDL